MSTRMYALIWFFTAAAGAALYLFGELGTGAQMAAGFFTATVVFMGVVAVLPRWMENHFAPRY